MTDNNLFLLNFIINYDCEQIVLLKNNSILNIKKEMGYNQFNDLFNCSLDFTKFITNKQDIEQSSFFANDEIHYLAKMNIFYYSDNAFLNVAIQKQNEENILIKYRSDMVQNSTNFMGIADVDGKLLYLNSSAYKMMGYDNNEKPIFNHIADVHANNFHEFALTVIQPTVFKYGYWEGRGVLRHKNGGIVNVNQIVYPLFNEKNEMYGTAAIMVDLTESDNLHEQVNREQELLSQIMNSIKIGVVLIDMEDNVIKLINNYACELLGLKENQVIGQKCNNVLCKHDINMCPHINEKHLKTIVVEREITTPDGKTTPIIKTGSWIKIKNKEYLIDTFVDISVQKDLEKGLYEAKTNAEIASRAKSEFLSQMSHEMRTPLNAVIGLAQTSNRTMDIDKLKHNINTIEKSSRHLLGLINDILDLSKIEAGKLTLNIEHFTLQSLIYKIEPVIRIKLDEKNLNFNCIVPEYHKALLGDQMRILQTLLNFLSNAIKFTPQNGKIDLIVSIIEEQSDSVKLYFEVKDNGIGMNEEQLNNLFKPFTQASIDVTRKYGGTGLGIYICKELINLMNGTIEVNSKLGEGSSFSFILKLGTIDEVVDIEEVEENYIDIFKNKTCLLVDDVELNCMVVEEMLTGTGMKIDIAYNGQEAFDKFLKNNYDVILMDIQMPIMNGYEATKAIRSSIKSDALNVAIIAMSANVFKEDIEMSIKNGMNAHIGKPIEMSILISLLKKNLYLEKLSIKKNEKQKVYDLNEEYLKKFNKFSIIDIESALKKYSKKVYASKLIEFMERAQEDIIGGCGFDCVDGILKSAEDLEFKALTNYLNNVKACLADNNANFAKLYMNDVNNYLKQTIEVINKLVIVVS